MNDIRSDVSRLIQTAERLESAVTELERENARLRAGANNRKKLTVREVGRIRELKAAGWSQADIADAFDVAPPTVSRIVRRIYWS